MCGRFALDASASDIKTYFGLSKGFVMHSRYNIAPGNKVPVIRAPGTEIDFLKWGLTPAWTKSPHPSSVPTVIPNYINARSETLFVKTTFKKIVLRQRCIIPATGYYEWKSIQNKKQPYYVSLKAQPLFGLAGIWDTWQDTQGNLQESCAIVTMQACETLVGIHERMPFILSNEQHALWLSGHTQATILKLLNTPFMFQYQFYPVSTKMNNPLFDTQQCIHSL